MSWQVEALAVLDLLKVLLLEPRNSVLIGLLLAAAWIDARTNRIPNALVLIGIAFAILYNGFYPIYRSENGWLLGLTGTCVGFIAFLPLYLLGGMGVGDVKLMAMVGAFLGPWPTVLAVLWTWVTGGVIALVFLVWTGNVRRAGGNIIAIVRRNLRAVPAGHLDLTLPAGASAGKLPYGVAIAAGTIVFVVGRQLGIIH